MAIRVPRNFDATTISLDPLEMFMRDHLRLKMTGWARFRHKIHIGNFASNLKPLTGSLTPLTKETYRELGKSHYEVILSLGHARLSIELAESASRTNPNLFVKSCKDFYFHIGCLLDNLARLIYIINDPQSAIAVFEKGARKGRLKRHWIDWGTLAAYSGYARFKRSARLRGIINIRNAFTHGWSCPVYLDEDKNLYWPVAVRTKHEFYWPHEEAASMSKTYRKKMPVLGMIQEDFRFMEAFQESVFRRLEKDVSSFEANNSVIIV